ncbi:MAG: cold shock domain-containing protein [Planctomycetota bacterium]
MARGKVKWFDEKKGYGFIISEKGDVFVHHTGIAGEGFRTLTPGEDVEFDFADGGRGLKAENVVRVSSPPKS